MSTSLPIVVHRLKSGIDSKVDLLSLHQLNLARYPYLLQSVAQTTRQVHFDILFAFPQKTLCLTSGNELIVTGIDRKAKEVTSQNADFLTAFDSLWRSQLSVEKKAHDLPFRGGWFLYLGYELAGQIEPSLVLPRSGKNELPIAFATRIKNETYLIAECDYESSLELIKQDIDSLSQMDHDDSGVSTGSIIRSIDEEPASRYLNSVRKIKKYTGVEG